MAARRSTAIVLSVAAVLAGFSRAAEPAAARGGGDSPVPLTIEVNGDLLIHQPIWQRAAALAHGRGYDFAPMLRRIRPFVRSADLALCHVETPMSSRPPSGYPVFNTPPALARAIRQTGWDACDTASNHTLDQGQAGIDATLRALNRAGIRHTGSAASARRARHITMLRARGVKVAYLAYTTITNGLRPPHAWSVNLARPRRIISDAARARRAGARAVIVNLHWGTEYQAAPDALQRRLVRRLSRSKDITAIVGQHVHVVQPIRRYRGRWIVYGEGNLLSNQTAACCPAASQDGMLVFLHLAVGASRSHVTRVDYTPTWVRHPDYTVLPIQRALVHEESDAAQLRASFRRTVGTVGRRNRLRVRSQPVHGKQATASGACIAPSGGSYQRLRLSHFSCRRGRRVARVAMRRIDAAGMSASSVRFRAAGRRWRCQYGEYHGDSPFPVRCRARGPRRVTLRFRKAVYE